MFEETLVIGEMADGTPVTVTVERLFPPRYQEKAIAEGEK